MQTRFYRRRVFLLVASVLTIMICSGGYFALRDIGSARADGSDMTIAEGQTVQWNSDMVVNNLQIEGTFTCADKDLKLTAHNIMVMGKGVFQCGTEAQPYTKKATITLTGKRSDENTMGCGNKTICAMSGGKLELHGIHYQETWTNLATTVEAGATQLTLAKAADWPAGAHIVVVASSSRSEESEEAVIKGSNGTNVTLEQGLKYKHNSAVETFGDKTINEQPEIGLLSHNILIQGDEGSDSDNFGCHVMIMKESIAHVAGVELFRCGQRSVLGRYAFHWHVVGDASGQYFEDSSVHHSYYRCITIHGTSNTLVQNNVCYDIAGTSLYMENGNETGNVVNHNLVVLVHPIPDSESTAHIVENSPSLSDKKHDFIPAGIYGMNLANTWINNAVASVEEGSGIWLNGASKCPDATEANCGTAYDKDGVRLSKLGKFDGNVAHGIQKKDYWRTDYTVTGTGFYITNHDNSHPVITNFTAYNNDGKAVVGGGLTVVGGRFANHEQANHGAVLFQDSLIVGQSKVFDIRSDANQVRGTSFGFNGGWVSAKGVTFANFPGNSAAIFWNQGETNQMADGENFVGIPEFKDIKFVDVAHRVSMNPVDHKLAPTNFAIVDDGSVSGTGKPGSIVFDAPISTTSDCQKADLKVAYCPYGVTIIGADKITRDDGASQGQRDGWFAGTAIVPNHTYALKDKTRFDVYGTNADDFVNVCVPDVSSFTVNGKAVTSSNGCVKITFGDLPKYEQEVSSATQYVAKVDVQ